MRVVVGPMAVHVYFEYGTVAVQVMKKDRPSHVIEKRRMVCCRVRPESRDKEEPAPLLGMGFAVAERAKTFDRIELRKRALWAALQDANMGREDRAMIWDSYGKSCRFTSRKVKPRLITPQEVKAA